MVKVQVEYCGKCNFEWQCKMLKNFLLENDPEVEVECYKGRQGSFEVKVDETLIHSKLQSLAFPNHESILENIRKAERGLPMDAAKQQPIENCNLM